MARRSFHKYLRGLRKKGGLIFFPCAIFAFTAPNAVGAEEITSGLTYATYGFLNGVPTIPSPTDTPLSSGMVSGISFDWGGGQILDSGRHEQVVVSFDGWIKPPSPETYYICAYSDDGFQLYLNEVLVIPDWWDRGPQCGTTADVDFSDGQAKRLTAYYYENGGGAVAQLRYYVGEGIWMPIPDSWYSLSDPITTTTTTTSTTTTTTTTIPVPITTSPPPINSIFLTVNEGWQLSAEAPFGVFTEVLFASYGTPEGDSIGSCHAANSVELVASAFLGKSSGTIDASNSVFGDPCGGTYKRLNIRLLFEGEPATTTTTAVPESTTTVPETTTTTEAPKPPPITPPTTEPELPSTTSAPPATDPEPPTSLAPELETETTVNEPEQPATSVEEQPSEEPVSEPETDEETPQEESEPPLEEEPEQTIDDVIEDALAESSVSELSTDQIAQIFSAETLESLSDEQISQLIESINPEELTEEQAEALAAALSAAPDEVKAEFESQINVFNGTFDSYVPKGSTISVGERRLIIAATCVVFAMPAPTVSRSRGV